MSSSDGEWRDAARLAFGPWFVTRASILIAGYVAALTLGYYPLPVDRAAFAAGQILAAVLHYSGRVII
jgi:hypothetical protein